MIPGVQAILKDNTGQMYTLEGAATAIMIVFLVVFIVQASPLTPLTSSASHQQVESQIETSGSDLLIVLDYVPEGETYSPLKKALVDWTGVEFDGQSSTYPNSVYDLTSVFNRALLADGTAYNLVVAYQNDNKKWDSRAMLWNGRPSDNAVLVSRKVVIHDEDAISASFIPDLSPNSSFYNILDVRLTLWRM
ncbi:MAG: hypothetical protein C5S33_00420 [ANME-2 cluster archaeon]|jgi:hypothetical protein|nr:hypothetical protein [ANME-2 cluster archaeon]